MPVKKFAFIWVLVAILAGLTGCAKQYVMTQNIEEFISNVSTCTIGSFTDELPADFPEENKPTIEEIDKFKNIIVEELGKVDIFRYVDLNDASARYEITGNILDYAKGSGTLRFLFGLGASKLTVAMNLIDKQTDQVIFAGNFSRAVSQGLVSGDEKYRQIAKDFAKELKKQLKKIRESQEVVRISN